MPDYYGLTGRVFIDGAEVDGERVEVKFPPDDDGFVRHELTMNAIKGEMRLLSPAAIMTVEEWLRTGQDIQAKLNKLLDEITADLLLKGKR